MNRVLLGAALCFAACTDRSLDNSSPLEAGAPLPICSHAATVVADNVLADAFQLALDDNEVFYPDADGEHIDGVAAKGGKPRVVATQSSQYLSTFDGHLFLVQQAGTPPLGIVDLDLSNGQSRIFSSQETDAIAAGPVTATKESLLLLGYNSMRFVLQIDRASAAEQNVPLTAPTSATGLPEMWPLGSRLAYLAADNLVWLYDPGRGTLAATTLTLSGPTWTVLASYGDELLLFDGAQAVISDEAGNVKQTLAVNQPDDFIVAFDGQAIYSSGVGSDAQVHVTPRDAHAACTLNVPSPDGILLVGDGALYAKVAGSASDALMRIPE